MAESGIYEIVNLVNGKRYVGSALKFRQRWASHRSLLKQGKHHSRHLQAAWQKYGEAAFEFRVIECCGRSVLLEREQHHIDQGCDYNKCLRAGSPLGVKHSDESRRKMSERRRGKPKSEAWKRSAAAGVSRSWADPEIRERRAAAIRESYSDDLRKTRSEQSKANWADPGIRSGIVAKITSSHTPERRAALAEQSRQRWADPEHRRRMSEKMSARSPSPETREKLRQANLGKKASDEARRNMSQGQLRRNANIRAAKT